MLGIGVVAVLGMARVRVMARAGFDCSSGGAGPESSPRPWVPPGSLSNVNQGDIPGGAPYFGPCRHAIYPNNRTGTSRAASPGLKMRKEESGREGKLPTQNIIVPAPLLPTPCIRGNKSTAFHIMSMSS